MSIKKVKVKSVKKVTHTGKVYDVTMKSNPHTFFANDILVHNSCYFRIIEAENLDQAEQIGSEVVKACDEGSVPMIVKNIFNGYDVMRSDFEAIARSTLSYGKKKQYAFLKGWEDGEVLPKPKLGITGLSIKRSDSPKQLSTEMKPFFTEIMKGLSHEDIKKSMDTIEEDYDNLGLYDLAAKRSANNMSKYLRAFNYEIEKKDRPYNIEKLDIAVDAAFDEKVNIPTKIYDEFMRTGKGIYSVEDGELIKDVNGELEAVASKKMVVPFHIKASILYNYLLKENNINDFTPILDGEKIKLFYIQPEKFNIKYTTEDGTKYDMIQSFDCIAFPSSSKKIPDFVTEFKPNKARMLETYFFGKMETIFGVIGFDKEKLENVAMDALF
jgi:hypothetical protein